MNYVRSRWSKRLRDQTYQVYVTDCLQTISENTARFAGGHHMTKRYYDIVNRTPEAPVQSEEEIRANVAERLRTLGGETQ